MPVRSWLVAGAAMLLALAGGIALGVGVLDGGDPEPAEASASAVAEETPEDTAARVLAEAYRERQAAAPVADRLTGRVITVIALPGASDGDIESVASTVTAAGGTVASKVRLTARLLDPADRQFTTGVAEQTLAEVADTPTDGLANYQLVGAALGRALSAESAAPVDAPAQNVLAALVEAKLVEQDQAPTHRAGLAVVVAGTGTDYAAGRGELLSTLVSGIDAAGAGALVAGPVGSGAPDGAVQAIRSGDAAESVSTVDVLGIPFGDVVLVTAIQQEADGTVGHYGTSGASGGPLPAAPTAAPTTAPTPPTSTSAAG